MPLPEYDRTAFRELGRAEGYAKGQLLLTYFPIGFNNIVERATKQAIDKNGGDAITDVIVMERYSISPIFISKGIHVRGMVLKRIAPAREPETDYERGRREERERLLREREGQ